MTDKAMYYEDYILWNLGARYQFTEHFALTARINNLLDEDFTTYQTEFVDIDNNRVYEADSQEVQFTDDYNVMAPARNLWLSLQLSF